ncbi:MAG: hypothetical protein HC880_07705 [Bacteroidia bacterium]|nr:hypothetical protein [Bacteroidia bacterium]
MRPNSVPKIHTPVTPQEPPRYKIALITWIAIYPPLTLILLIFGPYLEPFPLPLRTLVLTAILVPMMVYFLVPMLRKLFRKWLQ